MFIPAFGQVFRIIDNQGPNPIVGRFDGLPQGATVSLKGWNYRIDYFGGDGNDVTLSTTGVLDREALFGLGHFTLGSATLSRDAFGSVRLSAFGSSGDDGVETVLDDAPGWQGAIGGFVANEPGGSLEFVARGSLDGTPGQTLSRLSLHTIGGEVHAIADSSNLGANAHVVELYGSNGLLRSTVVVSNTPLFRVTPPFSNPLGFVLRWDAPVPGRPSMGWGLSRGSGNWPSNLVLAGETSPFQGVTHVRVVPRPTRSLPALVPPWTVQLTGSNLDGITLADEAILYRPQPSHESLAHRALGQAELSVRGDRLTLSNLGASREDGVSIEVGGRSSGLAVLTEPVDVFTDGSAVQLSAMGTLAGASGASALGTVGLRNEGGETLISADFAPVGSFDVRVEVFNGSQLAGTATVNTAGSATHQIGYMDRSLTGEDARLSAVGVVPPDLLPVLRGLAQADREPRPCYLFAFDAPASFVFEGPAGADLQFTGDRLRLLPASDQPRLQSIATFDIKVAMGEESYPLTILREKLRLPTPVITRVFPPAGRAGDVVEILGRDFGESPNELSAVAVTPGGAGGVSGGEPTAPFRVLSATDTRLLVRTGEAPAGTAAGPIQITRGVGGLGVPVPASSNVTVAEPIWVWERGGSAGMSQESFSFVADAPPPGATWHFSGPPANGQLSLVLPGNWPLGAVVRFTLHAQDESRGDVSLGAQAPAIEFPLVGAVPTPIQCAQRIAEELTNVVAQRTGRQLGARAEADPASGLVRLSLEIPGGRIDRGFFNLCVAPPAPPVVITDVIPRTAREGDLLTIVGSGFGEDADSLWVGVTDEANGRLVPMEVIRASDTRLLVRLGSVPPDLLSGPIFVRRGGGHLSWPQGRSDSGAVQPAFSARATQPGATTPFSVALTRPLPAIPLGPTCLFSTNNSALPFNPQFPTHVPGPAWMIFNGGWPSNSKVTIEATVVADCWSQDVECITSQLVSGNSHFGVYGFRGMFSLDDFKDSRGMAEFVGAKLGSMLNEFLDQLLPSFANPPGNSFYHWGDVHSEIDEMRFGVRLTPRIPVPQPGNWVFFSPGLPGPVVVGSFTVCIHPPRHVELEAIHTSGEHVVVSGEGFGNEAADLNVMLMNGDQTFPLTVLSATDTRLTARLGPLPPGVMPGPIRVDRGAGRKGRFRSFDASVAEDVWVWSGSGSVGVSPGVFSPQPLIPDPRQSWFFSGPPTNGALRVRLTSGCPDNSAISVCVAIHNPISGIPHAVRLPLLFVSGGGSNVECASRLAGVIQRAFWELAAVPVDAAAELLPTGDIQLVVSHADGPMDRGSMVVSVNAATTAPMVATVSPGSGVEGDIVRITGSGFGNDPDDLSLSIRDGNGSRLIPLQALSRTPTSIVARVGNVPPDARPGPLVVSRGDGNRTGFVPAFPDVMVREPGRVWHGPISAGGPPGQGAVAGPTFDPRPTSPPPYLTWFHSGPPTSNGVLCLFLSGDWPSNALVSVTARAHDLTTGAGGFDLDAPANVFTGGGTLADCAGRVADIIRGAFKQQAGVDVGVVVETVPGAATMKLTVHIPGGFIDRGFVSVCINEPARIAVVEPAAGEPGDRVIITGSGFGTEPNHLLVYVDGANGVRTLLNVLSASETQLVARVALVAPDATAGPIVVTRGLGARSFPPVPGVVHDGGRWSWTPTGEISVRSQTFTPEDSPLFNRRCFQSVAANGVICLEVTGNWSQNTYVTITAGITEDPPSQLILTGSWSTVGFYLSGGPSAACAEAIRQVLEGLTFWSESSGGFGIVHCAVTLVGPDRYKFTLSGEDLLFGMPVPITGRVDLCYRDRVGLAGIVHAPRGMARLDQDAQGLRVSNLGASGNDGVRIELGAAQGWSGNFVPLALGSGQQMISKLVGAAGGSSNRVLATTTIEAVAGQTYLSSDWSYLGSPGYLVAIRNSLGQGLEWAVFNNNERVAVDRYFPPNCTQQAKVYSQAMFVDQTWTRFCKIGCDCAGTNCWSEILVCTLPIDPTALPDVFASAVEISMASPTAPGSFTILDEQLKVFDHLHAALGAARFESDTGGLTLAHLGALGGGGVSIKLDPLAKFLGTPPVRGFKTLLAPLAVPEGGELMVSATGEFGGMTGAPLGEMIVAGRDGTVKIATDFAPLGATRVRAEVYANGTLAGGAELPDGDVTMAVPGAVGGPPRLVGCGKLTPRSALCYFLYWDRPATWELPGGLRFVGDEVRLLAADATAESRWMSTFDLKATGLDQFTIIGEAESFLSIRCPSNVLAECASPGGTPVAFTVEASTVCGSNVTVTCVPPSGSLFPPGVTTVNCVGTDACGQSNACSFTITVRDTTAPLIACPSNTMVASQSSAGTAVLFNATAADNCDSNVRVVCTPPSGGNFPLGTTTVWCVATDAAGLRSSCRFDVTVRCHTNPPVFDAFPSNVLAWVLGTNGTNVFFDSPTATDSSGRDAPVICEPGSGSFFQLGTTIVTCTAADDCDNHTQASFTVTLRAFQRVEVQSQPLQIHGPFVLPARALRGLPEFTLEVDAADDFRVDLSSGCDDPALCQGSLATHGEPLLPLRTPLPTTSWQTDPSVGGGVVDPQIAASRTHLVITLGTRILFYDKSGELVTKDKEGEAITNPIRTMSFFAPLIAPMNGLLNLPPGLTVAEYGINTIYDARLVFDEYRNRFWIGALARNKKGDNARRSFFVAAVSSTDDPRDDWLLYFWPTIINDGTCPPDPGCPYERGSDYPALGISEKYLLMGIPWGFKPGQAIERQYNTVLVASADALASGTFGGFCPAWMFWDFKYPDGNTNKSWDQKIFPAVHHGPVWGGYSYLANTYNNGLAVWILDDSCSPPACSAAFVPLQPYHGPANAKQPASSEIPNPMKVRMSNVGNIALNASFRDSRLNVTWQDCRRWSGATECATSIRLAQVVTLGGFALPVKDRTFGRNNIYDDNPDDLIHYATPGVEMNRHDDLAVVYIRSGETVLPEARFSTWHAGEADIRPSRVLKAGEFTLGVNDPGQTNVTGQTDWAGICVDPFDDTAMWMAHAYAVRNDDTSKTPPLPPLPRGIWNLAVGKVFGSLRPDWYVTGFQIKSGSFLAGNRLTLAGRIVNGGDGDAPATRVAFRLKHPNINIPLGDFVQSALASGQATAFTQSFTVPPNTPACHYVVEMEVDPDQTTAEYSEANNLAAAYLLPRLSISNVASVPEPGSEALIRLTGNDPCDYIIQVSDDLQSWSNVSTQRVVNGSIEFRIPTLGGRQRFYRVLTAP